MVQERAEDKIRHVADPFLFPRSCPRAFPHRGSRNVSETFAFQWNSHSTIWNWKTNFEEIIEKADVSRLRGCCGIRRPCWVGFSWRKGCQRISMRLNPGIPTVVPICRACRVNGQRNRNSWAWYGVYPLRTIWCTRGEQSHRSRKSARQGDSAMRAWRAVSRQSRGT